MATLNDPIKQPYWAVNTEGQYDKKLGGANAPSAYGVGTAETSRLLGMSSLAGGQYQDSRQQQLQGLGHYQNMIEGKGPSVAEQQMQQGLQQSVAAQRQLAASGRGGNMAGAQRQASAAGANMQMQGNQQAAMMRAQEQQAAMQGYSQLAGQMAGQSLQQQGLYEGSVGNAFGTMYTTDHDYAAKMRQMDEQERSGRFNRGMAIFNTASNLIGGIGGAMSDERAKSGIKQHGTDLGDALVGLDVGSGQVGQVDNSPNADTLAGVQSQGGLGMYGAGQKAGGGMGEGLGSIMGMIGGGKGGGEGGGGMGGMMKGFGMSDRRAKTSIGYGSSDERAKMGARNGGVGTEIAKVPSATFEYKPGAGPPGRRAGIMAQDLERSPLLSSLVIDTPRGKMVDQGGLATAAFAQTADQERRIRALEGKK